MIKDDSPRSPQPITAPNEIMRDIFEHWDDEARKLRAGMRHLVPKPSEAEIDDCLMILAAKMLEKPRTFQSLLHSRRWMRMVCRNFVHDDDRYSKKFQELEDALGLESEQDWLNEFEDEDLEHAALARLDEENAELL